MTTISATSGNSLPVVSNTSANTSAPASTPEAASTPAAKPARPAQTKVCDVFEGSVDPKKPAGNHLQFHCPVDAPTKNDSSNRSAEKYTEVIAQFEVKNNHRYNEDHQHTGSTYCSTFVWDVTKAMGAEIPYWTDQNGKPAEIPAGANILQMADEGKIVANNSNSMIKWLEEHGQENGWTKVEAQDKKTVEALAQAAANEGKPVVATTPGHVGMVRPGEVHKSNGPALAQAGRTNFEDRHVKNGFGDLPVTYWVHNPPPATAEAATDVAVDAGAAVDAAKE